MKKKTFLKAICVFAIIFSLSACSRASGSLTLAEQIETLEQDLRALFHVEKIEEPLTLYEAMAHALKYNMDHRLAVAEDAVADGEAALARLSMLPSLDLKGNYLSRNKESASSSRSIVTGAQSLEPSVSTEKYRKTVSLEASWNILDTGLAFVQSSQETNRARIATERRRKVVHNIVQDVRSAYWRAAGAQEMLANIEGLMEKGEQTIVRISKAEAAGVKSPRESLKIQSRLLGTMDDLMTMRAQLSFAHVELASLMNLPPSAEFKLTAQAKEEPFQSNVPDLGVPVYDLEKIALVVRPEIREESFQKRIAANNIDIAFLETFPGVDLILSQKHDTNKFLEHDKWANFSLGFTQSIIRLFTLPARLDQAKTKQKLADFKRQALAVAIMAQVHVADARFDLSKDRLQLLKRIHVVNDKMVKVAYSQKIAETLTEGELLEVEMGLLLSRIRTYLAFAEMQNAYGQVINSLGVDLLPEEALEKDVGSLAVMLESSLTQLRESSLKKLASYIKSGGQNAESDFIEVKVEKNMCAEIEKNSQIGQCIQVEKVAQIEEFIQTKIAPLPSKKPITVIIVEEKSQRNPDIAFLSFKGLYPKAVSE